MQETGLAVQEQREITPMSLIQQASAANQSVEQMAQLFDLQLRWEANQAWKAYSQAFADFKNEAVVIVKNVTVTDGPLKNKAYADLFGVVSAVIPALSKHGLSHSWKLTKDDKDWMEVTCTIKHVLGHTDSVSMGAAPDTGPGRNAIQARGSAKTYLERYTFLAATGLAAGGTDNDGNTPTPRMTNGRYDECRTMIESARTEAELKDVYLNACKEADEIGDSLSKAEFEGMKNKRFREIKVTK